MRKLIGRCYRAGRRLGLFGFIWLSLSTGCLALEETEELGDEEQAALAIAAPPRYWAWPQSGELDGALNGRDVDFQDPVSSTGPAGEQIVKGVFDGPYSFDGTYAATLATDGSQSLTLVASGMGHDLDVTISVSADGQTVVDGTADGQKFERLPVVIGGSGTVADPYSISFGEHTIKWATQPGDLADADAPVVDPVDDPVKAGGAPSTAR